MKLANILDSKSSAARLVGSSPTSGTMLKTRNKNTAYVIGFSIGDGNLSSSNGRTIKLRVTCDDKYPVLKKRIVDSLKILLPNNAVSEYKRRENCTDVYCHSKSLEEILGWSANGGSKYKQRVRVPNWIFSKKIYIKYCLKGLIETDGSIYMDRKYKYVNFTTIIVELADDVERMIQSLGYKSNRSKSRQESGKMKYVVRICKNSEGFIKSIDLDKS